MRLLLWVDVATYVVLLAYVTTHAPCSLQYWAGLAIALTGLALWITARLQLGPWFTVRARATALVTRGLYSKIRHPIYVFGDLAVVGLIVAWGDLDWLSLVALDLPFTIRRARKEEAVLEAAFGDRYRQHRAQNLVLNA